MSDQPSINDLLSDFHPATKAAWSALADKELGNQNPFEKLTWIGPDGLHVKPYYDKTDLNTETLGDFQLSPGHEEFKGPRSWDNLPPVRVLNESDANKKALQHLTSGADGILFELTNHDQINFTKLLTDIELEFCNVSFIVSNTFRHVDYSIYLQSKDINPENIKGSFFRRSPSESTKLHPSQNFHDTGIFLASANPIDEVCDALIKGNAQIQKLINANCKIGMAISSVSFSIGIDSDFFATIAKLKALRYLWFQLARAYGLTDYQPDQLYIHSRSEPWVDPKFQPHGNMLKATTAAMAGILGGANGLSSYPEDSDHEVMSRIALNTSHVLREESHLNKVADPLAGAYMVENMMQEIAEKAWGRFQNEY